MSHQIKIATLVASIIILLLVGTALFHNLEGWSWVDSFYFTGVTLTTVGFGDITPTLPLTKVLTVFFAFIGISIVLFSMTILAKIYLELGQEKIGSRVKDLKNLKVKVKGGRHRPHFSYKRKINFRKLGSIKTSLTRVFRRSDSF